jgi:tRNA uridine 5-carboxymethylaminomethyl modification enzyme
METNYDVIVVGGGHAGCEAAAAAAKLGVKTLLITMNLQTIGQMSCNPAMGGIAKGQIIREIDALGGLSGIVTDKTMIQFRMLNRSKGPAMWSPRAQSDRWRFAEEWRLQLEGIDGLDLFQDMCTGLIVKGDQIRGVRTSLGVEFYANAVVLTNGTFLNGLIHIGEKNFGGGRAAERSSVGITEDLMKYGFESGRMKTGTPPRVDGRSLNYRLMEEQYGDENPEKFSFSNETKRLTKQHSCWITYTSDEVHDVLKTGFSRSPMFSGAISGKGPRYCPSIEDKIERFADRNRHQLFIEPEGWQTNEVYINGFSTSLPFEVQVAAMKKIKGFENVKLYRPGYAIEYDYFPPIQLSHSLETKLIEGLFFAGQINGTTGYEEAACQGLVAGINAARKTRKQSEFILRRDEAYIGVLIDDLITKGTEEPYRMFTSRAEYRLLLRQDNADVRLSTKGVEIGLASVTRAEAVQKKQATHLAVVEILNKTSVRPEAINPYLEINNESIIQEAVKLIKILQRPGISLEGLAKYLELSELTVLDREHLMYAETEAKYQGYIKRERETVEKMNRLESLAIPTNFNYSGVKGLSSESLVKLNAIRPSTIGHAARISGVAPSDINILLVYMGR